MTEENPEAPLDGETSEPEPKKLKLGNPEENDAENLHRPSTSSEPPNKAEVAKEEDVKENGVDDIKMEETKPETSKASQRSQSRLSSVLDTTELYREPIFAEICSFLNLFGSLLGLKTMSFTKLEVMFVAEDSAEGRYCNWVLA